MKSDLENKILDKEIVKFKSEENEKEINKTSNIKLENEPNFSTCKICCEMFN